MNPQIHRFEPADLWDVSASHCAGRFAGFARRASTPLVSLAVLNLYTWDGVFGFLKTFFQVSLDHCLSQWRIQLPIALVLFSFQLKHSSWKWQYFWFKSRRANNNTHNIEENCFVESSTSGFQKAFFVIQHTQHKPKHRKSKTSNTVTKIVILADGCSRMYEDCIVAHHAVSGHLIAMSSPGKPN